MDRLLKLSIATLLLATLAGPAWASGGGEPKAPFPVPLTCYSEDPGTAKFEAAHCDLVPDIEGYRDPVGVGIGELLSHRISANPFNLIGSLIFLIAILHTFMANKLTEMAHQIHHEHDERRLHGAWLTPNALDSPELCQDRITPYGLHRFSTRSRKVTQLMRPLGNQLGWGGLRHHGHSSS